MKKIIPTLVIALTMGPAFGQHPVSGDYSDALRLSYDSVTKRVTGYFQAYSGEDEKRHNPKFSCVFYFEGAVTGQKFNIDTYYPADKKDDLITGTLEIVTTAQVKIKLPQEHGGCWNVQPFANEPVSFTLGKNQPWIQIRYVNTAKAYFYSDRSDTMRLRSYLVKGNFVCIDRIEQGWAYCTYFGKKPAKGWLKLSDLNQP